MAEASGVFIFAPQFRQILARENGVSGLLLLLGALGLGGCAGLVPDSETDSSARSNPAPRAQGQTSAQTRQQVPLQSLPREFSNPQCLSELSATGAQFAPIPDSYHGPGCNTIGTVQLDTVLGDRSNFSVSNVGPLQCGVAKSFGAWARFGVDRAARQILGSPLAEIETMGSYSCRNIAGTTRRSAHARAAAIDVSAFVLQDGRRISLEEDWNGGTNKEREFLRTVHRSACRRFGTVLGPDYNAAHRDHFHLEGSGGKFCR